MTDWIAASSVLILMIVALRWLLQGKISLRLQYALWAIVLLRLLLPVQLGQTPFSVLNAVEEQTELHITVTRPLFYVGETPDLAVSVPDPSLPEETQQQLQQQFLQEYYEEVAKFATPVSLSTVLRGIWIAGATVIAAVFFISNLRFSRRLRRSRRETELRCGVLPVYISPLVDTPCLFGLLRPAVYATEEVLADETALRHVLAHEETHYRHGDHIWAALRGLCLALHWYNPLVWLAASLSRRDGELACDEGTLQRLGEAERTAYGETLIALTCGKQRGELLLTATTMTGSKRTLRQRITLIAKRPKMAAYTLVAALLVVTIAAGCTFTGGKEPDQPTLSYIGSEEVDAQVLSAVRTYIIAHAAIVNDLAGGGDFITAAEIHSIAPSPEGSAENGLCLYKGSYYLQYDDPLRLDEIAQSDEFAQKWQAEGTNGSAPVPNPFHSGFFSGEVLAPYSEPGIADYDQSHALLPISYSDTRQHPEALFTFANEWVRDRAQQINSLTATSDFIAEGDIQRLELIDTASVSEFVHVRLYALDYRLRLTIPDEVNMELPGMVYSLDAEGLWLVEEDSANRPILVIAYWYNDELWTYAGTLTESEIAAQYGGDYTVAAAEFYESVRSAAQ